MPKRCGWPECPNMREGGPNKVRVCKACQLLGRTGFQAMLARRRWTRSAITRAAMRYA